MKWLAFLVAFALVSLPTVSSGQEADCTSLLRHGIYDHIRESTSSANASQATTSFCSQYSSWRQSSSGGGGGLSILGVGGLSGSYSRQQAEALASMVCSHTNSASAGEAAALHVQDRINATAVQAWQQCVALNTVGLRSRTEYRESDQAQMTLSVWYVPLPGAPATTRIDDLIISPADAMKCSGTLVRAATNRQSIRTDSMGMSCERPIAAAPLDWHGRKVFAKPGSVTIVSASGSLTRYFAPLFADSPVPPLVIPVGTIIPFVGTADDAIALRQNGWWSCDGQTIVDPLSPMNGKPTPTLNGKFLLGSVKAGESGGKNESTIPSLAVSTTLDSFENGGQSNLPKHMTVHGIDGWRLAGKIYAHGTTAETSVQVMPPYYTVLYLIRVR